MDFYKEIEFKKHLLKVCRDKKLREFTIDYFKDLKEKFQDQSFTKDNFETLHVYGMEIEQDVVKNIFATKDEVSAEEVFLDLFKHNVKKIKTYDLTEESTTVGYYSCGEKSVNIGIRKTDENSYEEPTDLHISKPENISEKDWKKQLKAEQRKKIKETKKLNKEQKKLSESKYDNKIKHTLYHELSHVFETKTFENGKYIRYGINNELIVKSHGDKFMINDKENINKETFKTAKIITNKGITRTIYNPKDVIRSMSYNGAVLLSEILNEEITCMLDDSILVQKNVLTTSKNLDKKSVLKGWCAYNKNYDIPVLLKLAVRDVDYKDLRFNAKKVIENINNLNISTEKLQSVKENFIKNFENTSYSNQYSFFKDELMKELMSCNVFETITTMLNVYNQLGERIIDNEYQTGNNYKAFVHDLFIESIKNDIVADMKNPNISKDEAFFEKVDITLKTIDQFILYPNFVEGFYIKTKDSSSPNYKVEYGMFITTVEQYANKYSDMTHLTNFNELINEVKKCASLNNINFENLSFFKEQKEIEEKRMQLIKESELAIKGKGSDNYNLDNNTIKENLVNRIKQKQENLDKDLNSDKSSLQDNDTTNKEEVMGGK